MLPRHRCIRHTVRRISPTLSDGSPHDRGKGYMNECDMLGYLSILIRTKPENPV